MEATTEAVYTPRPFGSNTGCTICQHPDREAIHRAVVVRGEPVMSVALRYGTFSRKTLHRHLAECVQSTFQSRREDEKLESTADFDKHINALYNEAQDGLIAAKKVLLIDGDLCFDPRAAEVSIVYKDWTDCDKQTHEPKLKTAKLSKLLAMIAENGYEPQHSYIKAEDMRKTWRDCLALAAETMDRIAKMTGIYKKVDNQQEQLDLIKANIMKATHTFGTTYADELRIYLENHAQGLRPDLRGMLEKECLSISAPLTRPAVDGKALHPSPALLLGPSETEESPNNSGKIFLGTIEVEECQNV